MKNIFTIKIIFCFLISLTLFRGGFSQSSIEFQTGTTIEVTSGADICAETITINGTYSGDGTKCNGPLPVELSLFTATISGGDVRLNWKTETEINNFGFEIERQNGLLESSNSKFEKIGFVNGNGNTNSPKEYSFRDQRPTGGNKFLYRLKQIDNDGQFEFSDIVEVEIVPVKFELSQNYPNPFNPSTTIRFSLPVQTHLKINIYNMLGELVKTISEGTYEAGYYSVSFDAAELSSGTYIYRIESENFTETKKMILMK
ncbi:MAG TPA: T9SS type A sorting domain-containing protein [Ignavibacteriaceae bacterium]